MSGNYFLRHSLIQKSLEAAGLDIKSLVLNLASTLLFVLPFIVYSYSEHTETAVAVVAGSMMVSLLVPPIGWRRPHPYSDDPKNYPYPRKVN
jgi:hypothetical protein